MKAVQITRFGGPEVLELVELPLPVVAPGQLLVKVGAAGVNFAETLMRENRYALTPPLPSVLGSEVAGIVDTVGAGVTGFAPGERVIAPLFAANVYFGGYAEYVAIDARWAVPVPDAVAWDAALALTVQGLSALHLVRGRPLDNKTVLVSAAAGGVGSLLVQLAKRAGARRVIAAASTEEKRAFALSLGADAAVDYTQADWLDALRQAGGDQGPDVIFESTGGSVTTACLQALAPRGEVIIYGSLNIQEFHIGVPELLGLIFNNQSVTGFALAPLLTPQNLRADLEELFALNVSGALQVKIGGSYPLAQAADAHKVLQSRGTIGKIVLLP
ncbi:quinone oxidoreductase family protein [Xanthobacter aminoxidans]|uniref:quinone oxidoreductase family protein n=1 Tax=Xanthobacter aminoxidans TaxID=186280 RepID=UPI0037272818